MLAWAMIRLVAVEISSGLARRKTNRILAGVAGGTADMLGVPDAYVRAAFLTLSTVWGVGAVLYGILWGVGYETVEDRELKHIEPIQGLGLGLAFLGFMGILGFVGLWPNVAIVITMATLSFGLAFVSDHTTQRPLAALLNPTGDRPGLTRLILGGVLLAGGLITFATTVGPVFELGSILVAVLITALGVLIAFGPAVRRLIGDLAAERGERIRQEERAEMAAHLHDSVLQTLALIQRSDDPNKIAMLARLQETELRDWLYGSTPLDGVDLMSTALRQVAMRVEQDHGVPVDVVTVGDHPVDGSTKALIRASAEAMVNAAKHSGAPRVSVYLEVADDELNVYVTDQGKGFDPSAVDQGRKGISHSIKSRVERAGGTVIVISEPGEGTELVMSMPVTAP